MIVYVSLLFDIGLLIECRKLFAATTPQSDDYFLQSPLVSVRM